MYYDVRLVVGRCDIQLPVSVANLHLKALHHDGGPLLQIARLYMHSDRPEEEQQLVLVVVVYEHFE